jgi:hypothetical protein
MPARALYLLMLAYGIAFAFSPTLFSGFTQLQTDHGDTILNHYFLEHSWRWVSQRDYRAELWSPAFFYPEKDVLGYSDNLFGAAPVYWALRCGFDDVRAYQLWMMLGFASNFVAMAVVLRWFGLNHALAALGAFLFAFGTPHVQQIGHQQLTFRCWAPFAIYFAWRFSREPSASLLFRCLICIVWQFFAVVYAGWFLAFGLACFGIALLGGDRETRARLWRFGRERPLAVIVPVLVNAALLAALVIPYLRANQGYRREFGEVLAGLPRWNSWLSVPPGTLWHSLLGPVTLDMGGEGYLCGGLTFLVLGVLGARASFDRRLPAEERLLIRSLTWTVVALLALSLSIWVAADRGGSLWFVVFELVPGATAIRAVVRLYTIVYPMLAIAGLLALQRRLDSDRFTSTIQAAILAGLLTLAAAENYFPQPDNHPRSFAFEPFYQRAHSIAREIEGADAAYGVSRLPCGDYERQLMMMWAGLYANVPVVNGYSGRLPHAYPFAPDDGSIDLLKRWLGPDWHGILVVVSNGETIRSERWRFDGKM